MATTRATATATRKGTTQAKADSPSESMADAQPTREDILEAALWVARKTNRVPTLLGPTASGKTYGVHELAKHQPTPTEVVTVLLAQHTPEEIAGFQLAINNELVVQVPYWFRKAQEALDEGKNVWILFDELGLSREETRGALYTFFRDRELHGKHLSVKSGHEVLVWAASNPATFAPPFRSRCNFFHVPADQAYLIGMARGDLSKKVARLAPISSTSDPAYSNDPPPSVETIDASAIAALNALDADFWRMSDAARFLVLASLVPAQTLSSVLKDSGLDTSALARHYEELLEVLRVLPRDQKHSMINNVIESLPSLTKEERTDALLSCLAAVFEDKMADDLETYYSTPRSEAAVQAVSELDPEYLEKRLRERNLLYVDTDSKGQYKIGGYLADQIKIMVEATKNQ